MERAGEWRGKRVLLTGHTGFKGAWLAARLRGLGAEVTGLALPPGPGPSLSASRGDDGLAARHLVDLREAAAVRRAVRAARPEIVFHLAAQALVGEGLAAPAATFAVNVMGTVNLLEALREVGSARAIVVVTSDKCYRDPSLPCTEDDPLGGLEPYGASKAACEHVIEAYRHCYLRPEDGVGLASARAGNVVGGGDFGSDRLLPDLVRAFLEGREPVLRAPDAIRPWQHVLDALEGYLMLAEALLRDPAAHARAWNFGPAASTPWRVSDVAAVVAEQLGGGTWRAAANGPRFETAVLRLSAEQARRRLGWRPRLPVRLALAWTVEGYRRLLKEGDCGWMEEQIERFQGLAPPSSADQRPPSLEVFDAVA